MGCVVSVISHLLHISEKLSLCFTCAALVSCIIVTITLVLCVGIGIGYNYCYIDFKTKHRYVPARYRWVRYHPTPHWRRSGDDDAYYDYLSENGDVSTIEMQVTTSTASYESDTTPLENTNEEQDGEQEITTNSTNTTNIADIIFNEIIRENATATNINDIILNEIIKGNATARPFNLSNTIEVNESENSKLLIPISGLDLISLLSKWRAENRNYSLQIVVS